MQIIKNSRNAAGLVILGAALTFAGCKGNGTASGADSAKTDSTVKTDSVKTDSPAKADSVKMAPADSAATPPSHVPQQDTSGKTRPLVRKTKT